MEELGPIDPAIEPLLLSIGRAVLGAAALEKVLLVDIANRRAQRDGFGPDLGDDLARLERLPAGALLQTLQQLGIDEDLAGRISELIGRRNRLVHGFMDDADVIAAFESRDVVALVQRVDEIALDCQRVVNQLAPSAFAELEQLFGVPLEQLIDIVLTIEPDSIADTRLRDQLTLLRATNIDELRASIAADRRQTREGPSPT
jgi:hypothetical protein